MAKRPGEIEIQPALDGKLDPRPFHVMFYEGGGMSTLAKCKTLAMAKRRAAYFRGRLERGQLLKEDKSVWL